jgi:hypothetical protein
VGWCAAAGVGVDWSRRAGDDWVAGCRGAESLVSLASIIVSVFKSQAGELVDLQDISQSQIARQSLQLQYTYTVERAGQLVTVGAHEVIVISSVT